MVIISVQQMLILPLNCIVELRIVGIKKSVFNTVHGQCKVEHTVFTYLTVSYDYAHDMCCMSCLEWTYKSVKPPACGTNFKIQCGFAYMLKWQINSANFTATWKIPLISTRLGEGVNFPLCCPPCCLYNIYSGVVIYSSGKELAFIFKMAPTHANFEQPEINNHQANTEKTICVSLWQLDISSRLAKFHDGPLRRVHSTIKAPPHTHTHTSKCSLSPPHNKTLARSDLK